MELKVSFPGGAKVDAEYKGFLIRTDQSVRAGGSNSAPAPFDYFIASIGSCAGVYVLNFLRKRNLPVGGVSVTLSTVRDKERARLTDIVITVDLPKSFPEKYRDAIARAVDLCTVKRQILDPPRFSTVVRIGETHVAA